MKTCEENCAQHPSDENLQQLEYLKIEYDNLYENWLDEFNTITDKRLLWDLIKYRIRQVSMEYGKEKAREKREKVTDIEASLKTCEENCAQHPSDENLQQLEYLKIEYDNLYEN